MAAWASVVHVIADEISGWFLYRAGTQTTPRVQESFRVSLSLSLSFSLSQNDRHSGGYPNRSLGIHRQGLVSSAHRIPKPVFSLGFIIITTTESPSVSNTCWRNHKSDMNVSNLIG